MAEPAGGTAAFTCAVLTPRGRGAVATIAVTLDAAVLEQADPPLFVAANGRPWSRQELGRLVFGHWGRGTAEEVVLCRIDERSFELHCHGGEAAVARIFDDLRALGCRVRSWQERQASHGRFDLECQEALIAATTWRTAAVLLRQGTGLLREALTELSGAPWSEEGRHAAAARLNDLLAWSRFGLHLSQPWSVVLAGRPNVGKSSLINALVGYARSIVFDQPGTTRDVVTAETALAGWPVRLSDTAGVRAVGEALESAGIARGRARLADADCRLLLVDLSQAPVADDWELLAEWPDALVVGHKCDLPDRWGEALPPAALRVSSRTGEGLAALVDEVVARLVPRVPADAQAVPVAARQVALLEQARAALEAGDEASYRRALETCLS